MEQSKYRKRPNFSAQAFWGADNSRLAGDKSYIITIVFEQGNSDDISEALNFYSDKEIQTALTQAPDLRPRAVALAQNLFNLKDSDFKSQRPKPARRTVAA